MFKRKSVLLAGLLLAVTIVAGCSAGNTSAPAEKEIVITAKNMAFEPNEVTVDKGTKVKLTLKNDEDNPNSLMIEGTDIKIENVAPKEERTVEFTADRQGEFAISGMEGMSGKFIVRESP